MLSRGGTLKQELGQFKGAAYKVPASALADLAADPEVVYISPDRPLHSAGNNKSTAVLDYHTAAINAPAAWALGLDGTGIGVAVIDSGIAANSDLNSNNVVYSQDFYAALGQAVQLTSTATALMSPASSPETATTPPDRSTPIPSRALPTT